MPLTMRKKKGAIAMPMQIHQDKALAQNAPITRSKRRSSGSPAKHPSKKRAFGDITNVNKELPAVAVADPGFEIHQDKALAQNAPITRSKRRSSGSPAKHPSKKRAFGDITNAIIARKESITQKVTMVKTANKRNTKSDVAKAAPKTSMPPIVPMETNIPEGDDLEVSLEVVLLSQESPLQSSSSSSSSSPSQSSSQSSTSSEVEILNRKNRLLSEAEIQDAVATITLDEDSFVVEVDDFVDIDKENKDDPNQSPHYAQDVFKYLKEREEACKVRCYFSSQLEVTKHMRAVLVDWMVEVQENFELNHETLYLALKLVDHYLMKKTISRDSLQLLGATGLFIACKFDERCPPALDDFIYICDDAYNRQHFIDMEMEVLRQVDFNLGIPLSYRFLRRYAKCSHASMEVLTLARFVLEMSLMHSQFMETKDSILASAALLLAFKMMKRGVWDNTLEHYSGYKEDDIKECVQKLNSMLSSPPNKQLMTIRNKYSHKVFYEVANITPLDSLEN